MAKFTKANARDVAKARQNLTADGGLHYYAASLSGIHRSSSFAQQVLIEQAIVDDGMQHLFGRHQLSGAMIVKREGVAA